MPMFDNPEVAKQFVKGFAHCTPTNMKLTGKECPECGEKTIYPEGPVIHLDPPRRKVKCTKCTFDTYEETEQPPEGVDIEKRIIERQTQRLESRQKSDDPQT